MIVPFFTNSSGNDDIKKNPESMSYLITYNDSARVFFSPHFFNITLSMFPSSFTFHSFQKSFSFPLLFPGSFQAKLSFPKLHSDNKQRL